ncbi:leucine-rich repeat-containing protein 3B-like isoform X1 [Eleginops maclovinus]|uniref:leucine-rich repeat-containing protein 3B-like isoform X1 n=1 Tax=Eleginops maclovinus TaxID=56733 RepID=UPI003080DCFC
MLRSPSSSSPVVELRLLPLILLLNSLVRSSSPATLGLRWRGARVFAQNICQCSETVGGGLTLRCSGLRLTQIPLGFPNITDRLFLDRNVLSSLPADSFSELPLDELDLSHNQLSSLDPGCFGGLDSLRFLDLSFNRLTALEPASLGGLRSRTNLTHNPWHCNCRMQLMVPELVLDRSSLPGVVCQTSDLHNLGTFQSLLPLHISLHPVTHCHTHTHAHTHTHMSDVRGECVHLCVCVCARTCVSGAVGRPLVLLMQDWDLCLSVRRNPDVVMLVTMVLWFSALVSILLYYIRQNQQLARQHMEYVKALQRRSAAPPAVETCGNTAV